MRENGKTTCKTVKGPWSGIKTDTSANGKMAKSMVSASISGWKNRAKASICATGNQPYQGIKVNSTKICDKVKALFTTRMAQSTKATGIKESSTGKLFYTPMYARYNLYLSVEIKLVKW